MTDAWEARVAVIGARDIPFAFAPHTDVATLLDRGFGVCAPKHALLIHHRTSFPRAVVTRVNEWFAEIRKEACHG